MYTNTKKDWDDLKIDDDVKEQLQEAAGLLQQKTRSLAASYHLLFRGPAGSAKKNAASLLAKIVGKPIHRIDLSQVVSKYIGETEKNLEKLFDAIKDKGEILFFDEADALFGKRTDVKDSHDKYANQEVSYLLQKLEEKGLTSIVATEVDEDISSSVLDRFHKVVDFHRKKS